MQHNSIASVCLCSPFLLSKANVNSGLPKLVQTARESDEAELLVTSFFSLSSAMLPSLFIYMDFQEISHQVTLYYFQQTPQTFMAERSFIDLTLSSLTLSYEHALKE